VHDDFDAFERTAQAISVANVADEVSDRRMLGLRKFLSHLELLQFVAAVDDQAFDLRVTL